MALLDTDSLIVVSANTSNSLPDPATVNGLTHDLVNVNGAAATVTSTGATPFLVDGVGAATVSVPSGGTVRVRSNGTQWVLIRDVGARRVFSAKGTTDASGNVTFTFSPSFATVPVVVNAVETSVTDGTETRITAISTSSVTFNARRSPAVTVLGISVLSAPQPAVGFVIHVVAVEAAQV